MKKKNIKYISISIILLIALFIPKLSACAYEDDEYFFCYTDEQYEDMKNGTDNGVGSNGFDYNDYIDNLFGYPTSKDDVTKLFSKSELKATEDYIAETMYAFDLRDGYLDEMPLDKVEFFRITWKVYSEEVLTRLLDCGCFLDYLDDMKNDNAISKDFTPKYSSTEEVYEDVVESTEEHDYEEHNYIEIVTIEPTCTEKGEMTYTCSCGDIYTDEIAALGHKAGKFEITKKQGLFSKGETVQKCLLCGRVIRNFEIEEKICPSNKALGYMFIAFGIIGLVTIGITRFLNNIKS